MHTYDLIYLPEPSLYDAVDFKFIHDDGICIRLTYETEGGWNEIDINEDFTIGEALDLIEGNIKDADQEYEWIQEGTSPERLQVLADEQIKQLKEDGQL